MWNYTVSTNQLRHPTLVHSKYSDLWYFLLVMCVHFYQVNIKNRIIPQFYCFFCQREWLVLIIITVVLFRYVRFINDSEPRADDVIESWSGFSRMLTHHTAPLMSSVTPFVCGPPLYLWQALHFLLQAGRVFAAWWFQGFRALCPYSTPLFDSRQEKQSERGGAADRPTARRRLIDQDD